MWLLISERGESFLITPKEEHIVSRRDGSITLSDDQSISRQHAKLLFDNEDANSNCGVILVDSSSKYGTFVNEGIQTSTRISQNEKVILRHNDIVRFGLQWNIWRVVFMPLVVLTSTLKQPEKQLMKAQIEKLGGQILSKWSPQCTHLTMDQITLTVKVVSALGAGQHIVSPKYWQNLLLSVETKQGTLPDPNDCLPPLNEATLNENQVSFRVNKQRSTLFKSLLFVATSPRQKTRIEPMVSSAGGKVVDFDECNLSNEDYCKDGIILMQSSYISSSENAESQAAVTYQILSKYLASKGIRCIPESDIGLSIVYCSREKFCNPKYDPQSVFESRQQAPLQQTESPSVIAQETEENCPARLRGPGKVIDETVVNTISPLPGRGKKRPSSTADEDEKRPSKKPAKCKDNKKVFQDIVNSEIKLPKTDVNAEVKSPKIIDGHYNEVSKENVEDDKSKKDYRRKDHEMECSSQEHQEKLPTVKNKKSVKQMNNSDDEGSDDEFCLQSQKKKSCNFKKVDENKPNDELKKKFVQCKTSNKRMVISDSDEEDEFYLPSQKKRKPTENFGNGGNNSDIKNKINEVINLDDGDDNAENGFPLPSEKKRNSKMSLNTVNSEQDIFDPSHKNDDFKVPTSVDMFQFSKSLSPNHKERNNDKNASAKLTCVSKKSVDVFDTSNTFSRKSSKNNVDDDDNECDFEFSNVRLKGKKSEDMLGSDNIFSTPKNVSSNKKVADSSNDDVTKENPFQSNKLSRDIFEASLSSTSDNRGIKRRISIEEPPSKKLSIIDEEVDQDERNNTTGSNFDNNPPENMLIKEDIKQEPIDASITDEELHDSTVVLVKSLIAPFRNVNISNQPKDKKESPSVNFKKFRKATVLKIPEFIDLVPYKEQNRCWLNETHSGNSSSSDDNDDGWSFQQSQATKQTKNKTRKVK